MPAKKKLNKDEGMEVGKEPFEKILERMETIVEELEGNELPLEEALERFERGVALSKAGAKRLDDAERRIEEILKDGSKKPLDDE